MPNLDLPILVVDDAKFSSMVVARTLKKAGYRDVRIAHHAPEALGLMEDRPVSVLIADWLMQRSPSNIFPVRRISTNLLAGTAIGGRFSLLRHGRSSTRPILNAGTVWMRRCRNALD